MLRHVFTLAAALSLLLWITASIRRVRSYWVPDRWLFEMSPAGSRSTLFSERGWIKFLPRCYQDPQSKEVVSISFVGAIGVPYALIVVLTAILPVVWLVVWRGVPVSPTQWKTRPS